MLATREAIDATFEVLAETAYDAYRDAKGVAALLAWDGLLVHEKMLWRHVVNQVIGMYAFSLFAELCPHLVKVSELEEELSLWRRKDPV